MLNFRQLHIHRFLSVFLIVAILIPSANSQASTFRQSVGECGIWKVEASTQEKDARIRATIITEVSGSDCRGAVRLSNETDIHGFGGYTFELKPYFDNAEADWVPTGDPDGKTYLLPPLDIEIHATPLNIPAEATISIRGDMTLRSFSIDLSLFLLRTGFALIPGTGCVISEEQLMFAALRTYNIVGTAASLSLKGDFVGAKDELVQVLDEFYERAGDALKDIGAECAVDLVQSIIKKPLAIVKIGIAYLTWIPIVIFDYFKYEGQPVNILLVYVPSIRHDSAITGSSGSLVLRPGEFGEIMFDVQNTGNVTWLPQQDYALTNINHLSLGASPVQPLANEVPPGQVAQWMIPVTAPLQVGTSRTEWQMTHEGEPFGAVMAGLVVVVPEGEIDFDLLALLEEWFNELIEQILAKLAEFWENLKQQFTERLEREVERLWRKFVQWFERELQRIWREFWENLFRQCCGASVVPPAIILFGALGIVRRRRRRERGTDKDERDS